MGALFEGPENKVPLVFGTAHDISKDGPRIPVQLRPRPVAGAAAWPPWPPAMKTGSEGFRVSGSGGLTA